MSIRFSLATKRRNVTQRPYIDEKMGVLIDCIRGDVRMIVDIRCGDGAISNVLAEEYMVMGGDRSQKALKHLLANMAVVSSAECLPF
jgi:2-polyprenyl-3-methyl-5-hydroxy-6-metoxy-1,4-benzoquinol methylase